MSQTDKSILELHTSPGQNGNAHKSAPKRVEAPNRPAQTCPFQFIEQGSHAAIVHEGREIVRIDKNISFFGLSHAVRDQVMILGGKPEIAFLPVLSAYPGMSLVDVRYEAETHGDLLSVRMIPTKLREGDAGLTKWREEHVLSVRLEEGHYVWTQQAFLNFFADVDLDADDNGMQIYRFHHPDGRPARMFQYFDPLPAGSSGPAVPMGRDWLDFHEPYSGPDTFRQHWRRDYVSVIFQDPDDGFSTAELNKTLWSHLTRDNRRSRPCAARGMLYLVKDTGEAIACDIDAPSHFHHVCEWGIDFHAWCDLDPFARGSIVPAGTRIICTTTYRLIDRDKVAPVLAKAKRIELTPAERAIADRPAYEEPENSFTVSALDRLDAQVWQATSEGCSWRRDGGYKPNSGCLVIHNDYAPSSQWQQSMLGSQNWGNPIIFGARYRLSAWVRVDDFQPDPSETAGPQVGIELSQENGPAMGATRTVLDYGWSASLIHNRRPLLTTIAWTKIELVTPPVPNYVLRGVLKLRLGGRGTAYFSNVRWEAID